MKRENYDKLRNLLTRIDEISNYADKVNKIINGLEKSNDSTRVKIYAYINGENYETELPPKLAKIAYEDILNEYHSIIIKTKNEIDSIIDSIT